MKFLTLFFSAILLTLNGCATSSSIQTAHNTGIERCERITGSHFCR